MTTLLTRAASTESVQGAFMLERPTTHALLEVDVTEARDQMKDVGTGHPTMTAFVLASLGRAVAAHPLTNARRVRRHVVPLPTVDVVATVERTVDGARRAVPFVVHDADRKTVVEIADELRADRVGPLPRRRPPSFDPLAGSVQHGLARLAAMAMPATPRGIARLGPPIGVASVGMFGVGWGIPVSTFTLMATIGGVSARPVLTDGHCFNHEFLPLTLSFDHTVVGGAPAARFATFLRELLETAAVLEQG